MELSCLFRLLTSKGASALNRFRNECRLRESIHVKYYREVRWVGATQVDDVKLHAQHLNTDDTFSMSRLPSAASRRLAMGGALDWMLSRTRTLVLSTLLSSSCAAWCMSPCSVGPCTAPGLMLSSSSSLELPQPPKKFTAVDLIF